MKNRKTLPAASFILLFLGTILVSEAWPIKRGPVKRGVDEENCLMCHKYPKMGLHLEGEAERIFFVSEKMYAHSVHAKVSCRGCHKDIKQIPHEKVRKPVDCATTCHIKEPFSNKEFSHAGIKESFMGSVHWPKKDDSPEKSGHKPDCKYCHLNPLYYYHEDYETTMNLKRCVDCHEPEGVERAFEHMLYRIKKRTSRSSQEIVDLCSSCHMDGGLMKVFDRTDAAAEGYREYFHGKAVRRGWGNPAHCVDCHSAHHVLPKDDSRSTVNSSSLVQTCGENPSCHPKANRNFVHAAVHVTLESDKNRVLFWVDRIYKLLIAGTISFFILHILLDLARRLAGWMALAGLRIRIRRMKRGNRGD